MKTFARVLAIAVALALAACGNPNNGRMQGWIEGDFVFVGPDEMGRVEMLNVREGILLSARRSPRGDDDLSTDHIEIDEPG